MTKSQILQQLSERHQTFVTLITSLSQEEFLFIKSDKWTAGQQLDHIYRSVKPLKMALGLPKFVPRLLFGKANRPSKDYDNLVKKYVTKLESNYKVSKQFLPRSIAFEEQKLLKNKLLQTIKTLCNYLNKYTESELDHYILPHPLLGKLTLREMLYFTMYHVEHHQKSTLRNLGR